MGNRPGTAYVREHLWKAMTWGMAAGLSAELPTGRQRSPTQFRRQW